MRVGVNALTIKPGYGGVEEQYLRRVLATMREVQPEVDFVLFTDADNDASFEVWERVCVGSGTLGLGWLGGMEGHLERAVGRAEVDILFTPLRTALTKSPVPQAVFAMELMAWEQNVPKRYQREPARLKTFKRVCKDATAAVVPSKFLQRKCLELLDLSLDKVIVAPLGVDEVYGEPHVSIVEEPYVLTVGVTDEFKNFPRLLAALERLRGDVPEALAIVGPPGDAEPDHWGPNVVRIDQLPSANLAGLYQHCAVFVCASLYEGSGITVLEAMRAGAPVATSRVGGIPEVAGDLPAFFDPESVETMVRAIRRVLETNASVHERRCRFGKQIAADYTWEKCAWKTLSAFRRI